MKKGKKLLAIIVGILMMATIAVTVAACGGSSKKVVGMFWYRQDDIYLSSVRSQVNDVVFNGNEDFQVKHFFANNDEATLDTLVKNNIDDLDVAIVNPVNGSNKTAMDKIVKYAKDAKVPVAFFNKEVADEVLTGGEKLLEGLSDGIFSQSPYYIGTISSQSGVLQGELIGNFLLETGNIAKYASGVKEGDKEVIYYAMLRGQEGHADSDARTYYSVTKANEILGDKAVLRHSPLMSDVGTPSKAVGLPADATTTNADILKYIVTAGDKWDGTIAAENFDTTFSAILPTAAGGVCDKTKLGIIISNNDGMALSVVKYLQSKSYNLAQKIDGVTNPEYKAEKYIPIVGVDGDSANLALIKDGAMTGTVGQSSFAYAQLFLAFSYAANKDVATAKEALNNADLAKIGFKVESARNKVFFNYDIRLITNI